jgi:PAS domain S-box-containing protein/putative nucleotidyltransferase with HDIG domain
MEEDIDTDRRSIRSEKERHIRPLDVAARRMSCLIGVFEDVRGASRCTVDRQCCGLSQVICSRLTEPGGYLTARIAIGEAPGPSAVVGSPEIAPDVRIPIEYAGKRFGELIVSTGDAPDIDRNERALLSLIAADVGRALHSIEMRAEPLGDSAEQLYGEGVFWDCFEGVSVGMALLRSHGDPLLVNKAFADLLGYERDELERLSAVEALELVSQPEDREKELQLLHQLIRRRTPSYTMEKRFLRKDGSVIHAMVTTTFFFDPESDVFRFGVLSVQDISENARIREELDRAYEGAIDALTAALESRDPYTAGHQRRVTRLACAIADEMELPDTTRMAVEVASTLHDIGKIAIPAEILTKPYGVSDAEFSVIKAHPVVAYEILKETHFPWPVADIVLQHHERLDGSGYPAGLRGSAILLEARILSVADTVEALASHRPYRPAVTVPDALDHIVENRSVLFDPDVVDACLRTFESGFRLEETGSPPSTEQTVD